MKNLILIGLIFTIGACTQSRPVLPTVPTVKSDTNTPTPTEFSGVINGGGGKGALCTKNGQSSLEVLDLYDGRVVYGLSYSLAPKNREEMLNLVAEKLTTHFGWVTEETLEASIKEIRTTIVDELFSKIKFTKPNQRLKLTKDAHAPIVDSNCEEVQIGIFYDEAALIVDSEYWEKMKWLQKTGFLLHEFIYYLVRKNGAQDSIRTRRVVGHLLSDEGLLPIRYGQPENPDEYVNCHGQEISGTHSRDILRFFAKNSGDPDMTSTNLVFTDIGGQFALFNRQAIIKGFNFKNFLYDMSKFPNRTDLVIQEDTTIDDNLMTRFDFSEYKDGSFKVRIWSEKNRSSLKTYNVRCFKVGDQVESSKIKTDLSDNVTVEFIKKYGGNKYLRIDESQPDKTMKGESIEINSDGKMTLSYLRHVGSDRTPDIPHGTICTFQETIQIIRVEKYREPKPKDPRYTYDYRKITMKLVDIDGEPPSSTDSNCLNFKIYELAQLVKGVVYSETIDFTDENIIRIGPPVSAEIYTKEISP